MATSWKPQNRRSKRYIQERPARKDVGWFVWNVQKNINIWSPELQKMYGIKGTPAVADWLQFVIPEDRHEVATAIQQAFETGRYNVEFRIHPATGSPPERTIYASGKMFFSKKQPLALMGVNMIVEEET